MVDWQPNWTIKNVNDTTFGHLENCIEAIFVLTSLCS